MASVPVPPDGFLVAGPVASGDDRDVVAQITAISRLNLRLRGALRTRRSNGSA